LSFLFAKHIEQKFLFGSLTKTLRTELPADMELVFLCIGIDRSTGDCFGPMTGTLLSQMKVPNVVGTLEEPVHAKNLEAVHKNINNKDTYIIAIDSSLGNLKNLGYITVKNGPLLPGYAMYRSLPPVGNMSITLNVNINGIHNYLLLQNSSLNLVWKGANVLAKSIATALYMKKKHRRNTCITDKTPG